MGDNTRATLNVFAPESASSIRTLGITSGTYIYINDVLKKIES